MLSTDYTERFPGRAFGVQALACRLGLNTCKLKLELQTRVTLSMRVLVVFACTLVSPALCSAQQVIDKMVATVNAGVKTDLITYSDLLWQLALQPTSQLDKITAAHIVDVLLDAADATGAALVIATHDADIAARLEQCWSISDGRLMTERSAA